MGQHLSGRRGGRGLAPLLLLLPAPRLDPVARPSARAPALPRGDGRRLRPAVPPATRLRGRIRDVGRSSPRLDRPARERRHRRVPRAHQRRGLPQRPAPADVARSRRLRGARVPHRPLGARARPDRQGRGGGRDGLIRDPGRPCTAHDGEEAPGVPARARVDHAEGRARLLRRGARRVSRGPGRAGESVGDCNTSSRRASGGGTCTDPVRRSTRPASSSASTTSTASSPTARTCAKRSRRSTPIRASGRSSRARSIRRSRRTTSSWSRVRWRR